PRSAFVLTLRPPIHNRHILALDITLFAQATTKRGYHRHERLGQCAAKEPDHGNGRLLRSCNERPRRRCAAEKSDELASPHSITSSARAISDAGTLRPSVRAVFRLMTSSNFVGCSTGRSDGLSPLRMRAA